jgi:predicted negative regulator of RcsB-dependent stress response
MSDEKAPKAAPSSHEHSEELQALRGIFNTYARPAVIVALGITVILVGINRFRTQSGAKEQSAAAMVNNAQSEAELETVLNDYPKTKAAPRAILELAKRHYSQARYPQAIEQYESFSVNYPTHEFQPAAQLGILICKAAQTPSEATASALGAFAVADPASYLAPQARLAQARCLKDSGNHDAARIVLEDMTTDSNERGWHTIADEQLSQLKAEIERTANPMPVPAQPEMVPVQLPATTIAPMPEMAPTMDAPGDPVEADEPATEPAQ